MDGLGRRLADKPVHQPDIAEGTPVSNFIERQYARERKRERKGERNGNREREIVFHKTNITEDTPRFKERETDRHREK